MKKIFLLFLMVFFFGLFAQNKNCLKDTKWISEIAPSAYDYYIFLSDTTYEYYSCELDEKFFGEYKFKKDTLLFIGKNSQFEETHSPKITLNKFIFKDHKMIPKYSSFQYDNGSWSKPIVIFDKKYFFSKDTTYSRQ